jgi:glycosyltransferase involved in cell wall biosynthesis
VTSVSIVMPSLNSGRHIGEAIQSVLDQEHSELELVIQDGGSSDQTLDVVRSFDDSRISWISEPDGGQSDALNKAIRRSRGEWILWLNADDRLATGAFARVVPQLLPEQSGVVHGDFGMIDAEGRIVKRYACTPMTSRRLLRHGAYVFSASVFFRRSLAYQVGTFDERLHYCMDYDWLLRLVEASAVHYEPGMVAFARDHADSKTSRQPWGFWREQWVVNRKHGASPALAGLVQIAMAAALLIRPFRRSRLWRWLRPAKRLGGRLRPSAE